MIIGHGDIASVLVDHPDRIYFASGVSNSSETRDAAYDREKNLLLSYWPSDKKLIYFSSLCIFYSDTRYAQHKMDMETLVEGFERYAIIRVGNILFGSNPRTLINHLRIRKAAGLPLEIQDAYRYVVDKGEFLHWLDIMPDDNCIVNIWGRKMTVREIIEEFV